MIKIIAAACALTATFAEPSFWMLWPDAYARGGGLGNQIEQLLGRVQCAATGSAVRTMVLPDLRADRSAAAGDRRHYAVEDVFDVPHLRKVAKVATWRDMLRACDAKVSFVVEGGSNKCDAFSPSDEATTRLLRKHARAYAYPERTQRCVVASGAVARNALPRCAVGLELRELLLLGPCSQASTNKRAAFKSARPCRGLDVARSPCPRGFRWNSALNASSGFLGLVAPRRASTHLAPCNAHALGRLDAAEPYARAVLAALRAAAPLRALVSRAAAALGTYDAIHIRLGDFGALCTTRPKFCPPSSAELARVFAALDARHVPTPVLLLADDADGAVKQLRNPRVRPVGSILRSVNASFREASAPDRLVVEVDLAVNARLFVGVACSTVSQLIVKRREALGRAFLMWP